MLFQINVRQIPSWCRYDLVLSLGSFLSYIAPIPIPLDLISGMLLLIPVSIVVREYASVKTNRISFSFVVGYRNFHFARNLFAKAWFNMV